MRQVPFCSVHTWVLRPFVPFQVSWPSYSQASWCPTTHTTTCPRSPRSSCSKPSGLWPSCAVSSTSVSCSGRPRASLSSSRLRSPRFPWPRGSRIPQSQIPHSLYFVCSSVFQIPQSKPNKFHKYLTNGAFDAYDFKTKNNENYLLWTFKTHAFQCIKVTFPKVYSLELILMSVGWTKTLQWKKRVWEIPGK